MQKAINEKKEKKGKLKITGAWLSINIDNFLFFLPKYFVVQKKNNNNNNNNNNSNSPKKTANKYGEKSFRILMYFRALSTKNPFHLFQS